MRGPALLLLCLACAQDLPAGSEGAEVAATREPGDDPAKADRPFGGGRLQLALAFRDGLALEARLDGAEQSVTLSARRADGRAPVLTDRHVADLRRLVEAPGEALAADEREALAALASRLAEVPAGTDLVALSELLEARAHGKRGPHATRAGWVSLCAQLGKSVSTHGTGLAASSSIIGPPPHSEDCFGRCGWGCDWRWLKNRYTQDCADHDACSRDLGWTSRECLSSLAGTFDDALFAPNCF